MTQRQQARVAATGYVIREAVNKSAEEKEERE
jgi:hypothetical protein